MTFTFLPRKSQLIGASSVAVEAFWHRPQVRKNFVRVEWDVTGEVKTARNETCGSKTVVYQCAARGGAGSFKR